MNNNEIQASLKEALPGITHIKWITDKESGQFYGSSFVEMANTKAAGRAVAMDGQKLLGRPLKVHISFSNIVSII
jgi:RNA recognition motif-containing protein